MERAVPAYAIEKRLSSSGRTITYALGKAEFEDLASLMRFAEENGLLLAEGPEVLGHELGDLVVRMNEGNFDGDAVREALAETTDGAYTLGARMLMKILREWADEMESAKHEVPTPRGAMIREELNRG